MQHTLAKVFSAELEGIDAKLVEVEVDLNVGLHSFTIVGLADKALTEAKERVSSAIKNTGFRPPNRENRKITVNLAPGDVQKTGTQYDVAIAIGYLTATGQMRRGAGTENTLLAGELALDGSVRPIPGALNITLLAKNSGFKSIILPKENAGEATLISDIEIVPVSSLAELVNHISETAKIEPSSAIEFAPRSKTEDGTDFAEIKGQAFAKRALSIAAAGGHNILMTGPPGSGKTMLAEALVSILPPITADEAVEVSRIWSAAGMLKDSYAKERPFRAPHHTASPAAIIGGGARPRPGEISLAHRGVLFLDELPEFRRDLLEALRQPLESGEVVISRARGNLTIPSRFMFVAAMNPCPCGFWGDEEKPCTCSAHEVLRYQKKVSGPLMDRIDIHITVPRITYEHLKQKPADSSDIRESIEAAREMQTERFRRAGIQKHTNAEMTSKECEELIDLTEESQAFLKDVFGRSLLSTRGYYRILKAARTIADMEASTSVGAEHIAEAFQLRIKE